MRTFQGYPGSLMNPEMEGPVQLLAPVGFPLRQLESHAANRPSAADPAAAAPPVAAAGPSSASPSSGSSTFAGPTARGSRRNSSGSMPIDVAESTKDAGSPGGSSSWIRSVNNHHGHGVRRIVVQTDSGSVVVVEVDRDGGAGKVKRSVQAALNVPTEQADLVLGGHVIEDLAGLASDVPVLLKRGITRSASSPSLADLSTSFLRGDGVPSGGGLSANQASVVPQSSSLFELVGVVQPCATLQQLLRDAAEGVKHGLEPKAATGGLGGAYYFRDRAGCNVVIVKPTDEEPFAPNNPNGYVGRTLGQPGLKKTIRVGEAGIREVAAFLLDHGGFSGVPCTALVRAAHPIFNVNAPVHAQEDVSGSGGSRGSKRASRSGGGGVGGWASGSFGTQGAEAGLAVSPLRASASGPLKLCSLQQYVQHDYDASEHGTSQFPVSAVHRIGILDIRLLNTDRHSGNILVRKVGPGSSMYERHHSNPAMRVEQAVQLIPIDHGFCLPETLEAAYFEWLHWPQASLPFTSEDLSYIESLDVEAEVAMLRKGLPMLREGCLRVLMLSTLLLQRGAAMGLTLADIGAMMSREVSGMDEEPSELERLCLQALKQVAAAAAATEEEPQQAGILASGSGGVGAGGLVRLERQKGAKSGIGRVDGGIAGLQCRKGLADVKAVNGLLPSEQGLAREAELEGTGWRGIVHGGKKEGKVGAQKQACRLVSRAQRSVILKESNYSGRWADMDDSSDEETSDLSPEEEGGHEIQFDFEDEVLEGEGDREDGVYEPRCRLGQSRDLVQVSGVAGSVRVDVASAEKQHYALPVRTPASFGLLQSGAWVGGGRQTGFHPGKDPKQPGALPSSPLRPVERRPAAPLPSSPLCAIPAGQDVITVAAGRPFALPPAGKGLSLLQGVILDQVAGSWESRAAKEAAAAGGGVGGGGGLKFGALVAGTGFVVQAGSPSRMLPAHQHHRWSPSMLGLAETPPPSPPLLGLVTTGATTASAGEAASTAAEAAAGTSPQPAASMRAAGALGGLTQGLQQEGAVGKSSPAGTAGCANGSAAATCMPEAVAAVLPGRSPLVKQQHSSSAAPKRRFRRFIADASSPALPLRPIGRPITTVRAGSAGSLGALRMAGGKNGKALTEGDLEGHIPGGQSIFLSDMEEEEWEEFYAAFENLLNAALLQKTVERQLASDRFGTSCQF